MGNVKDRTIYCHFSFKRPKGKEYGLFAVAFYNDFEGKSLIVSKTRKYELWKNHQFVTAIQSYEHALLTIYEMQGLMQDAGIRQVMLVTDNSTLAGWIEEPSKNKNYLPYMNRAVKNHKIGGAKEIVIGVGLCEPRNAEKSYKYCVESRVCNTYKPKNKDEQVKGYKLCIGEYQSISDIIESDINIPEIAGMEDIKI